VWCNLGTFASKSKAVDKAEIVDGDRASRIHDDKTIMQKLLAKKVFIASGADFGSEEPGWFRIVFTYPRTYMEEGLKRMIEALL
jgi:bifunctional pyridoxal-dependent enzyme with beta-cystathionase and maltose regulon repressor activities